MSTTLAYSGPIRRPAEREEHLTALPSRVRVVTTRAQKRARPKLVYALAATAAIFAIFLAQLLISISLSSGAYKIDGLQATQQDLGRTESSLTERLDTLGSDQNLEANAIALGMVGSGNAAFLQLSNGAVLGSASAATGSSSKTTVTSGANDPVSNYLLTGIPVIATKGALTQSTGSGHVAQNASDSTAGSTESTDAQTSPAQTGSSVPASSTSSDSGDLPSPVTH